MFSPDFISGSRDFTQDLTSGLLILIHSADVCVFSKACAISYLGKAFMLGP